MHLLIKLSHFFFFGMANIAEYKSYMTETVRLWECGRTQSTCNLCNATTVQRLSVIVRSATINKATGNLSHLSFEHLSSADGNFQNCYSEQLYSIRHIELNMLVFNYVLCSDSNISYKYATFSVLQVFKILKNVYYMFPIIFVPSIKEIIRIKYEYITKHIMWYSAMRVDYI